MTPPFSTTPSPFSLEGSFHNQSLAYLIQFWHLPLEGRELIIETIPQLPSSYVVVRIVSVKMFNKVHKAL